MIVPLIYFALAVFWNYCVWRILSKAGYPGWAFVLLWVPFVNLLAYLYFAFAKWPVQKELDDCRAFLQPNQVLIASERSEWADEDE